MKPLAPPQAASAVPLADRLARAGTPGPETPPWLAVPRPAPKPRPLRAQSMSCAVVPVAQSAEEAWRAERQRELEEARQAAEVEGLRMAQAKVEMLIERYLDGIDRLKREAGEARRPDPNEVVELALLVAREIVGREVAADREILARRLDETLAEVRTDGRLVVRLGSADMAYIQRRRPDLTAAVTFLDDATLGPGGCKVETAKASIDLGVAARLAAVREAIAGIVAEAAPPEVEIEEEE